MRNERSSHIALIGLSRETGSMNAVMPQTASDSGISGNGDPALPRQECVSIYEGRRQRTLQSLERVIADLEHAGRTKSAYRPCDLIQTTKELREAVRALDFTSANAVMEMSNLSQRIARLREAVTRWGSQLPC